MTEASEGVGVSTTVPRIYGTGELGILSLTAPGDIHPRVEYIGAELFVGLDQDGSAITQTQAEESPRPFADALADTAASVGALPAPVDGVVLIHDEAQAAAVLVDPARIDTSGLRGVPVVVALARDRVAIVGADDAAGVTRILALAEELYDGGGPLVSAHPLGVSDGAWVPFPWIRMFPALEMPIQRVLRLFTVRTYEAQGVVLRRPDVHVADPKIRVLESGVTTTFATWPRGTATLLPLVDNVIVADRSAGETTLSVTTMREFLDAAGDAVVRTGLSPHRYFVPGEAPAVRETGRRAGVVP